MDVDADMDVPISALDGPASQALKSKGRGGDDGKVSMFVRNLGGNVHRSAGVVKAIAGTTGSTGGGGGGEWREGPDHELGLEEPPLLTYISCEVEGTTSDILEVWNYENGGEFFFWFGIVV